MSGMSEKLDAAFRQWSAETAEMGPPPEVERAVLAEFDRSLRARRRTRWAAAASVAAAITIAVWSRPVEVVEPGERDEFTALPYVVQPSEFERTEVVRMTVPVAELIAAGYPMQPDPGAAVEADILLGQDRRARAVRLVPILE